MSTAPADPQTPTHYEVLGLEPEADESAIKIAHRRVMRANHPDLVGEAGAQACAAANAAFEILSDPARRATYDATLNAPPAEPQEDIPEWGQESDWESTCPPQSAPPFTDQDSPPSPGTGPEPIQDPAVRIVRPIQSWPVLAAGASCTISLLVLLAMTSETASLFGLDGFGRALLAGAALVVGALLGFLLPAACTPVKLLPQLIVFASVLLPWLAVPMVLTLINSAIATGFYFTWASRSLVHLQRTCDATITAGMLSASNVYGPPPNEGHRRVEAILDDLYQIPSVRVLRMPETITGLTHVITRGRRVLLIGTLSTPAEHLHWTRQGLMSGNKLILASTWHAKRRAILSRSGATATATLWLAPGRGTQARVDNPRRDVHVAGATQAAALAQAFLTGGDRVDQRLMTRLLHALYG